MSQEQARATWEMAVILGDGSHPGRWQSEWRKEAATSCHLDAKGCDEAGAEVGTGPEAGTRRPGRKIR